MQENVDEHRGTVPELSHGARVVVTVLVLVLPAACLALALTSAEGRESAWLLIAAVNLVVPAVMLPLVWRRSRRQRPSEAPATPDVLASR